MPPERREIVTVHTIIGAAILMIVALAGLRLLWGIIAERRRRRRHSYKTQYIYVDASSRKSRARTD
jgi:cytochrome b